MCSHSSQKLLVADTPASARGGVTSTGRRCASPVIKPALRNSALVRRLPRRTIVAEDRTPIARVGGDVRCGRSRCTQWWLHIKEERMRAIAIYPKRCRKSVQVKTRYSDDDRPGRHDCGLRGTPVDRASTRRTSRLGSVIDLLEDLRELKRGLCNSAAVDGIC